MSKLVTVSKIDVCPIQELGPEGLVIWVRAEMTQIMVLIYTDITRRDFVSVC